MGCLKNYADQLPKLALGTIFCPYDRKRFSRVSLYIEKLTFFFGPTHDRYQREMARLAAKVGANQNHLDS